MTERPRVDLTSRQQAAAPEQIALPLRRTAVTVAARPTPYRRRQPASTTEPAPVVVRIGRVELVVERQQPTAPPPQPARTAPEPPGHPDLLAARRRYAEPGWR